MQFGKLDKTWSFRGLVGYFHIASDSVLAPFNSDDLRQTNTNSLMVDLRLRIAGGVIIRWDTYVHLRDDLTVPIQGGLVHDENTPRMRTRLTARFKF